METEPKILFVVGAGASAEVGMPTGSSLKPSIAKLLDIRFEDGFNQGSGDPAICEALRMHARDLGIEDINPFLYSCWQIRDALPQAISIDNYLDVNPEDHRMALCGKLAIARAILEAERRSTVWLDPHRGDARLDFERLNTTWLNPLLQFITENCPLSALEGRLSRFAFVVFNYDRVLEHFLFHALQNYYHLAPQQAAELTSRIEIHHPYGCVGPLPWQPSQGPGDVRFGAEAQASILLKAALQLRTFTEGTDPGSSAIIQIKNAVAAASSVVFLGFAFHPLNLDVLRTAESAHAHTSCIGTAQGLSQSDCEIVEEELAQVLPSKNTDVAVNNRLACADLFSEYWRVLSRSRGPS